jgi:hypothetical protein
LVDPPTAASARNATAKASRVSTCSGRTPAATSSTAREPAASARSPSRGSSCGSVLEPGSIMPSTERSGRMDFSLAPDAEPAFFAMIKTQRALRPVAQPVLQHRLVRPPTRRPFTSTSLEHRHYGNCTAAHTRINTS